MKYAFKDLKIGEKFQTGKSTGMGIRKNIQYWIEYEKTSLSTAKIVDQPGYDNSRMIGSVVKFSAYSVVWRI